MLNNRLLMVLLASVLAAGCETTGGGAGSGDKGGETVRGGAGSGVETGTVDGGGMMAMDPLEDPDSPLSQRIIYFEYDRSDIPTQYLDLLSEHAKYLIAHPDVQIRLEGHADERGSREYNIGLGDRRAQSVRRILLFQGVGNDEVSTVSYGEERPAMEGHMEDSYAKNRRVEIIYLR